MKLILKQEVEHLGKAGDAVEVKDGYARNYLLPRRMAVPDTPHERRMAQAMAQKYGKVREEKVKQAQELAAKIASKPVRIVAKVSPEQKLFGSVTAVQIGKELSAAGIKIDRRKILLAEPIHAPGKYEVEVRVHPEAVAKVQVEVVGE